ncbi:MULTISPECIES: sigma-70 family RNA polymerase sigma factor [unclassified Lysinibacillus]|uniref:sigma-70 family RNA polymerase sigma factor n=1 Tax=unclassified Lysinibacillus TaxID=2636778 RepID=UPI0038168141
MSFDKHTQILSPKQPFEEILELVQPMITSILLKCHIYKDFEYYRHIAAIAVWKAYENANPSKGKFSSYIYTTVKGEILKELTKERRFQDNVSLISDATLNFISCREEQINRLEERLLVEKIMNQLKEEERKILQLYYLEGYRYEEIAKVLQLSVAAVKKRRTRLMNKLRSHLCQ